MSTRTPMAFLIIWSVVEATFLLGNLVGAREWYLWRKDNLVRLRFPKLTGLGILSLNVAPVGPFITGDTGAVVSILLSYFIGLGVLIISLRLLFAYLQSQNASQRVRQLFGTALADEKPREWSFFLVKFSFSFVILITLVFFGLAVILLSVYGESAITQFNRYFYSFIVLFALVGLYGNRHSNASSWVYFESTGMVIILFVFAGMMIMSNRLKILETFWIGQCGGMILCWYHLFFAVVVLRWRKLGINIPFVFSSAQELDSHVDSQPIDINALCLRQVLSRRDRYESFIKHLQDIYAVETVAFITAAGKLRTRILNGMNDNDRIKIGPRTARLFGKLEEETSVSASEFRSFAYETVLELNFEFVGEAAHKINVVEARNCVQSIYDNYISDAGRDQVNLEYTTRARLDEYEAKLMDLEIEEIVSLFDDALLEVSWMLLHEVRTAFRFSKHFVLAEWV